jgi:hypothetical protein
MHAAFTTNSHEICNACPAALSAVYVQYVINAELWKCLYIARKDRFDGGKGVCLVARIMVEEKVEQALLPCECDIEIPWLLR